MAGNMPAAEVDVDAGIVHALLIEQRPEFADREVAMLANGWDNVSFRIGDDLVGRLPRRALAVDLILNEARWLPELAPRLPLPIPAPVFLGEPGSGYPWPWSIVPLIAGDPVAPATRLDLRACAWSLGGFLRALHTPAPARAPENPFRGVPLNTRDEPVRERLERLGDIVDQTAAIEVWERALAAPIYAGAPMWLHGDLHPNNILAREGLITGVIDFGDLTSGDPATDLAVAWMLFPGDVREHFIDACGGRTADDWARARGWALALAVAYLAHSADNPTMHAIGETTMTRVLAED